MIIVRSGNKWYKFEDLKTTETVSPIGWLGEEVTPSVGDRVIIPSDANGYDKNYIRRSESYLPSGLKFTDIDLWNQGDWVEVVEKTCVCEFDRKEIAEMSIEKYGKLIGHLNQAGGYCCPHHGNTCGYHDEYEGGE